ncbi:MAG: GNAT family N-acetyltransferase [Gemmatimonadaceae bacterium]
MTSRTARIVVRRARTGDLDAVVALRRALIDASRKNPAYRRLRRDYATAARPMFAAQLADARCLTLLAVSDDQAIGLLRCSISAANALHMPPRHAYVVSVYVVPKQRRKGVLTALLRAADTWCREHDVDEMRLHVGVQNRAGNAAWEALGFEPAEILRVRRIPRLRVQSATSKASARTTRADGEANADLL